MTAPTMTLPIPAGSPNIKQQAVERMSRPDFPAWLEHVRSAAGCTHPVRLVGDLYTARRTSDTTAEILSHRHTDSFPDRAIYKACGSRLEAVPSLSRSGEAGSELETLS